MGKNDTLFKDREPQKPYPIPWHIPIKPMYRSTPPPPPPRTHWQAVFMKKIMGEFHSEKLISNFKQNSMKLTNSKYKYLLCQ